MSQFIRFNPYFTGLPILIRNILHFPVWFTHWFQSLFYWITYSYSDEIKMYVDTLNDVSILILLDYLFLLACTTQVIITATSCFNPYFTGLPILIPFCRENALFIIATEFFSDIKIDFFLIFLVIFC